MKSLAAQLAHFLRKDTSRKNLRALARLLAAMVVIVIVYSVIFHLLMLREGRQFTWFTGIYWTLTVMSTLGFGMSPFVRIWAASSPCGYCVPARCTC